MTNTQPESAKEAPWPGSQAMPRWNVADLIEAPDFKARDWTKFIGPGLVMGAAAIGGGEWMAGPAVSAKYGGALLWVATISILIQTLYNTEISRYALYTGEPIFTGKFRIKPGPAFWLGIYLMLDWGSIFPYLVANAAIPVETLILGELPDPGKNPDHWWLHKITATVLYALSIVPLVFGGKVYNSLRAVMSFKLVAVIGFLVIVSMFYSRPASWWEIASGFVKFGNVPVQANEDANGNGVLDPGEDFDGDKNLDVIEKIIEKDPSGKVTKWEDLDGDGKWDGDNVENLFASLATKGTFPTVDFSLIAMICGLAAIAGNGGLTNTPISNLTRDQGWGMGHHVGAIPSVVGGHGISLSHVGSVFEVNAESLPRWKRWYKHVAREQVCVWMGACLIGVALPSILSVEFLPRGTSSDDWTMAAMTAGAVEHRVVAPQPGVLAHVLGFSGMLTSSTVGRLFWGATLFCGVLVLMTSMVSTIDGFVRRWVDVFWTASPGLRKLETSAVRYVYFAVLVVYCTLGFTIIWLTEKPGFVFKLSTTGYNFAFAFSCWHTLAVNTTLLPPQLRPNWFVRAGLVLGGCAFLFMGIMAALRLFGAI